MDLLAKRILNSRDGQVASEFLNSMFYWPSCFAKQWYSPTLKVHSFSHERGGEYGREWFNRKDDLEPFLIGNLPPLTISGHEPGIIEPLVTPLFYLPMTIVMLSAPSLIVLY